MGEASPPPARAWAPDERASVTIWLLGVAVMVLFLAGFAVDLWQATAQRRTLAGLADAAATAGAGALDQGAFRAGGDVRLAPSQARQRAAEVLAARAQAADAIVTDTAIRATPQRIVVTVAGEVEATLVRMLRPDAGPWSVRVRATARPRAQRPAEAGRAWAPSGSGGGVEHVGAVDQDVEPAALAGVVAPLVQRRGPQRPPPQVAAQARRQVVGQPPHEMVDGLVEDPHRLYAALP
jgi:hypothetical protein